ncbi:hypothetical protein CDV36_011883 [Fusarium kuroshium]|uniref:Uncharacterized protein n=1 Tax=Fusarium kuroshium TaxID=2010991 RepID=A0A3M2RTC8_9HYPO|nr:hypothetical protein CDV36_011883 [Fusarium kuroshium]
MVHLSTSGVLSALLAITTTKALPPNKENNFHLRPFHIDLSHNVPRMIELVRDYRLPDKPEYPGVGSSMGINLDTEQDNLNKS